MELLLKRIIYDDNDTDKFYDYLSGLPIQNISEIYYKISIKDFLEKEDYTIDPDELFSIFNQKKQNINYTEGDEVYSNSRL